MYTSIKNPLGFGIKSQISLSAMLQLMCTCGTEKAVSCESSIVHSSGTSRRRVLLPENVMVNLKISVRNQILIFLSLKYSLKQMEF